MYIEKTTQKNNCKNDNGCISAVSAYVAVAGFVTSINHSILIGWPQLDLGNVTIINSGRV